MIKETSSALMLKSFILSLLLMATTIMVVVSMLNNVAHASMDKNDLTPLFFNVQPNSNDEIMARKALGAVINDAEMEVGRKIILATAREDLNGDGVKELFVRLLDPELFCEGKTCTVYGYAVTNDGLVAIADFKTITIDIDANATDGAKNIILNAHDKTSTTLTWNGDYYDSE